MSDKAALRKALAKFSTMGADFVVNTDITVASSTTPAEMTSQFIVDACFNESIEACNSDMDVPATPDEVISTVHESFKELPKDVRRVAVFAIVPIAVVERLTDFEAKVFVK